ncbi:MAG: 16S rRNA (cytosine(1402)-N(4))-methyltransferase RsmH [Patescibacteria group bacterium]
MQHTTVLRDEAVTGLALTPESIVVDATFGAGGHSHAIRKVLGPTGRLIAVDKDPTAIRSASFPPDGAAVDLVNDSFSNLRQILRSLHIDSVDAVLADLGWRSEQFADGARGFSFQESGPLLMTYGDPTTYPFTAYDIVNEWDEKVLADIIYGYGEDRLARRIARSIVTSRATAPIETTTELAAIIVEAYPAQLRHGRIHPATKTFQALRIAVNDELGVLEEFITEAVASLTPSGRLAIITFHSLEDRIVKHRFRELRDAGVLDLVNKRPITPTPEEVAQNPRARSAKLRISSKVLSET